MPSDATSSGNLKQLQWKNRVLICRASNKTQAEQLLQHAAAEQAGFAERELLLYILLPGCSLTFPEQAPTLRLAELQQYFNEPAQPEACVLLGKDGGLKLKSEGVPPFTQVFSRIDAMPMRQRELQQQQRKSK